MSGAKHKQKGSRVEREMVHAHRRAGIKAARIPLSGAAGGEFSGDIKLQITQQGLPDLVLRGEVKARRDGEGFKLLEGWLGQNDLLFLKRDRAAPLIVLTWDTWERLLVRAQDPVTAEQVRLTEEAAAAE